MPGTDGFPFVNDPITKDQKKEEVKEEVKQNIIGLINESIVNVDTKEKYLKILTDYGRVIDAYSKVLKKNGDINNDDKYINFDTIIKKPGIKKQLMEKIRKHIGEQVSNPSLNILKTLGMKELTADREALIQHLGETFDLSPQNGGKKRRKTFKKPIRKQKRKRTRRR
jgi:hypothetical protein